MLPFSHTVMMSYIMLFVLAQYKTQINHNHESDRIVSEATDSGKF